MRRRSALVLALLLVLPGAACKKKIPLTAVDLPDDKLAPGAGLSMEARFLSQTAEIEQIFHGFLPNYGVVPVLVAIRNNDTVSYYIHNRNALDLREEFNGFSLRIDGREILPLHPAEVMGIFKDLSDPIKYKIIGPGEIFAGIMLAPLGGYYLYREVTVGRFYRPMLKGSIYPALAGGMFSPVILEPGEEAQGYLYFPLDREHSPYFSEESEILDHRGKKKLKYTFGVKERMEGDFELVVRPGIDQPADSGRGNPLVLRDTLDLLDARFVRSRESAQKDPGSEIDPVPSPPEGPGVIDSSSPPADFDLFLLDRVPGKKKLNLRFGKISDYTEKMEAGPGGMLTVISASGAALSDAARRGPYAACAVNFKGSSKVYLIHRENGVFSLAAVKQFSRKTRRIFLAAAGLYVFTADAAVAFYPHENPDSERYVRLGSSVQDMFLRQDRLVVFKNREVRELSAGADYLFQELRRRPLPPEERRIIGSHKGDLVLVHEGRHEWGDTLVIYDTGELAPSASLALPGKITGATCGEEGIIVQLETGLLLHVWCPGKDRLQIHSSAFLPLREALTLGGTFRELAVIGRGGELFSGSMLNAPPVASADPECRVFSAPVRMSGPASGSGAKN
ncbi:MAG: hypothetical protein JXB45_08635 [Candidatus Krumholzibacteriota bacterium]|nr:hypothetical protein [Candidatus Krumholzibacteriota bacterium]